MENHKCKLCLRSFVNGKALGGHMRSHVIARWSSSSSSSEEYETGGGGGGSSVVVQDGESETELCRGEQVIRPKTPRFRRSKRIRKSSKIHVGEESSEIMKIQKTTSSSPPPASSISEHTHTSPEEDVAYCLILLSKDKWIKGEEEEEEKVKNKKARGKYRCESCSKVFRSYQALGGHRASHKKIKSYKRIHENAGEIDNNKEKIHECPICYRVFSSGQALGGHKRSHFTASARTTTIASFSPLHCSASTSINGGNFIDLNLPASLDDDETITQIELSALSDACFLTPH
nr:zinc finger protein ZAT9-like [Ipomoea batatas]